MIQWPFQIKGVLDLYPSASLDDWLTTEQVAQIFEVSSVAVTHMISKGRLKAEKKGWILLVHRADLPASWPPPLTDD